MGLTTEGTVPDSGCGKCRSISRCFTCSSANTIGTVLIGPQGTFCRSEHLNPVGQIFAQLLADQRVKGVKVLDPFDVRCIAGIFGQVGPTDGRCKPPKLLVIADRQYDVTIAHWKDVLRLDIGVLVALASRHCAGDQMVHRLIGQHGSGDIKHGDVDRVALAALVAIGKRRQHGNGCCTCRS